jgi:hypothetical protein
LERNYVLALAEVAASAVTLVAMKLVRARRHRN